MSEGISINVNQSQVRNAVRDIVDKLLQPEAAKQSFDVHVEKQKQRLTEKVDTVVDGIVVPKATVERMVDHKLQRDLDRMVRDIVKHTVEELVRQEVSVALRHIVSSGLTIELGTGWKRTTTIKTELKEG
jgi:hypothetical protein